MCTGCHAALHSLLRSECVPKIHMLKSQPQGDGVRRRGLWEVRGVARVEPQAWSSALMTGPQGTPSPSAQAPPVRTQRGDIVHGVGSQFPADSKLAGAVTVDLRPPGL